ncbi:hypothetical protein [Flavobacterium lipolyticum]|uniref:XRE family transcriptional regulator n=1 Tax=Flavobacterium lipolyticum TaxID=2893754 RepID=A0ABS8M5B7_9FLAO|nr:hypothetical protein [Flavobacterium sp. F-126]MCC9020017.1 hypothetical protein [Flavobacterium sp. F-126]
MIKEILIYKEVVNEIYELIDKSTYKKNYAIEKVGISRSIFYRKLKTKSFTPDEILEIAKILCPDEFYMLEFIKEIEQAKNDINAGRIITHDKMLQKIKERNDKFLKDV